MSVIRGELRCAQRNAMRIQFYSSLQFLFNYIEENG